MTKLGDKLSGHRDYDDDTDMYMYDVKKCKRCMKYTEPTYEVEDGFYCPLCLKDLYQELMCEKLNSWHKSFIKALFQAINDKELPESDEEQYDEELSPCCGAEPDRMFPNDNICSNCKEHF